MKVGLMVVLLFLISSLNVSAQSDGLSVYIDVLDIVNNGEVEKAEKLIDSLENTCLPDTNGYTYACVLACRAKMFAIKNEVEKSIELRRKSVKILEENNIKNRALAIFYADLGYAMRENDDFRGLDYYLKANDIFRYMKDWGSLAQSYNTIFPFFKDEIDASGCIYFSKLALYYFRKANPVIDSTDAKTLIFLSSFEQAVAEAFALVNEDSAKMYYYKAVETIQKTSHPYASYYKYNAYLGISTISIENNDYSTALKNVDPALLEFMKLGMANTQYHADILLYKGIALYGLNQLDSAENYLYQALDMYTKVDEKYRWRISCFKYLSEIEIKRKNYKKALEYAHKAMFANSPNMLVPENVDSILPFDSTYYSQRNYGENLLKKGRIYDLEYRNSGEEMMLEKSHKYYKYYMEFIINGYYKNTITLDKMSNDFNDDVQVGINNYLNIVDEMFQKTQNNQVISDSYKYLSEIKAGLMSQQTKKTQTTSNPELVNLHEKLNASKKEIAKYDFIRLHETISTDSLEKIHDLLAKAYMNSLKIRHELEIAEKQYSSSNNTNGLDVVRLMAGLSDDQVVVDYFYNDTSLYIYGITKEDIKLISTEISPDFIKDIKLEKRFIKTGNQKLESQSQKLYKVLIEPISNLIKQKKSIAIIPYEMLYSIPFEVLMNEKSEFLIEKYGIVYNFSSKHLIDIEKRDVAYRFMGYAPGFEGEKSMNIAMRDILMNDSIFRDVNILDKKRKNIVPLPYAAEEVSQIAEVFQNNGFYSKAIDNNTATESHFKENHNDYNIIHIASHGYASSNFPELSGVFFSNEDVIDNGYLFLSELNDLKLDTDLLVLSACQSGQGISNSVEGSISLPRGFMIAGVNNVIASLWKIHDLRTKELMVAFYKHLLDDSLSYSDAIRKAKVECIRKGFMPMDWSGFVLFGKN